MLRAKNINPQSRYTEFRGIFRYAASYKRTENQGRAHTRYHLTVRWNFTGDGISARLIRSAGSFRSERKIFTETPVTQIAACNGLLRRWCDYIDHEIYCACICLFWKCVKIVVEGRIGNLGPRRVVVWNLREILLKGNRKSSYKRVRIRNFIRNFWRVWLKYLEIFFSSERY